MTRAEGFRTPAERKEYCWHLPWAEGYPEARRPYTAEECAVWDFYWAMVWLYDTKMGTFLLRYT